MLADSVFRMSLILNWFSFTLFCIFCPSTSRCLYQDQQLIMWQYCWVNVGFMKANDVIVMSSKRDRKAQLELCENLITFYCHISNSIPGVSIISQYCFGTKCYQAPGSQCDSPWVEILMGVVRYIVASFSFSRVIFFWILVILHKMCCTSCALLRSQMQEMRFNTFSHPISTVSWACHNR